MSLHNSEICRGQTTYVNGKQVTITDTSDAFCVIVTDKDGNQMSVRKSTLMSTPLFDFNKIKESNERRIEEYQAKAREYEQIYESALKEQKGFLEQMSNLFREAGTRIRTLFNAEQQEAYDGLKKDYWNSRFGATDASNRVYSCYMAATDAAHDNAMLSSQGF